MFLKLLARFGMCDIVTLVEALHREGWSEYGADRLVEKDQIGKLINIG